MAPFEALYGRKCRSPICWDDVSPTKGISRFGICGKLSPRFIGPFDVLERVGALAYRLALPPVLAGVHNVFHVSMLQKCITSVEQVVELEPLRLDKEKARGRGHQDEFMHLLRRMLRHLM
ncbi:unnamed protein product [Rhodiola kirilowii]